MKRGTLELFIKRAQEIHGFKYSYEKAQFLHGKKDVAIICPTHGVFLKWPINHISGRQGCPKCKSKKPVRDRGHTIAIFREKHGDKYDYSLLPSIVKAKDIVDIGCPVHGVFQQVAHSHRVGMGCRKCADDSKKGVTNNATGWGSKWVELSTVGAPALYVVRLTMGEEAFYKVGITRQSIAGRLCRIKYAYDVILTINNRPAAWIYDLEKTIKAKFKALQYRPLIKFGGHTECYSSIVEILEFIKEKSLA